MIPSNVFVSFDTQHDEDLYDLLLAESNRPTAGFSISARSEGTAETDAWQQRVRERIRAVDQLIVVCGEHTEASAGVHAELRIAQEEETPYFLLWGRRDLMCTRPAGSKSGDAMYSWTPQILQDRIAQVARKAQADAAAEAVRNAKRSG